MSEIALISARKSRLESSAKKGIKVLKWRSILIRQINSVDGSNWNYFIGILTGIYSGISNGRGDLHCGLCNINALCTFCCGNYRGCHINFFSLVLGNCYLRELV
jgi:hypothetical protein